MTYESFLKVVLGLQKQERVVNDLYKNNINIADFVAPYHSIIDNLITEVYGKEGYEWFSWFCYENEYGTRGLEATDENGCLVCHSFHSLWMFLEKFKNGYCEQS